jgi:Tfp pilus assembly protein PilX
LQINNENGFVPIIASLMILVLLNILFTMMHRTGNTELQTSTNNLIYQKNFYAAESGIVLAAEWIKNSTYMTLSGQLQHYAKAGIELNLNYFYR